MNQSISNTESKFKISKEKRVLILVNIALISAQIGFGGFSVVGSYALEYIRPIVFAFFRELIAGPLLLILAAVVERVRPELKDWWRFVILGLVLYGNQLCYMMGLKLTGSATITAIMQQLIPVITAGLTIALRMESASIIKFIGIGFAVAGAVVMVIFKGFALNNRTIGIFVLMGNGILMSTYYIWQKPLLKKYPPITVTGWAYIVASFAMGLTSLSYVIAGDSNIYVLPKKVIIPLAYAVFVQTIFGYCCVSWANTHAPASLVAALQPLVAAILAYTFLHENLVWNEGAGAILVITGLGLVTWGRSREPAVTKPIRLPPPDDKMWLLSARDDGLNLNNADVSTDGSVEKPRFP